MQRKETLLRAQDCIFKCKNLNGSISAKRILRTLLILCSSQSSAFLSSLRRLKKWVEWPKLLLREFPNFVLKSVQPEDKPGLTPVGSMVMKEGETPSRIPFSNFFFLHTFAFICFLLSLGIADCE